MPFVPVPNVGEFHCVFNYSGQICENVLHFRRSGGYGVGSLNVVCQELADWWAGNIRPIAPATLTFTHIDAIALDAATSPGVHFTGLPLPSVGVSPNQQLPNNVSLAVKLNTLLRGRSFRGRVFHLGLHEAQVDGNVVNANALNLLTVAYGALVNVGEPGIDAFVVVSKFANGAQRAIGVATDVTTVSLESTVDSQRRRLPGRGA